jgi:hypothetical protein
MRRWSLIVMLLSSLDVVVGVVVADVDVAVVGVRRT